MCLDVRLETGGLSCLAPQGEPGLTVPLMVQAGGQSSNTNLTITYYTPINEISELIQDRQKKKRINLTQCPDYYRAPERLQYVIVAVPPSDYGQFFDAEGAIPP